MKRLAVLGLLAAAPVARAAGPVGEVRVDCSRAEGWAQDPDEPGKSIDVHLYFDGPAGDPAAVGIAVTANLTLRSGCSGEQCVHGFGAALPLSRFDGAPHPVHAYGIDTVDPNLELSFSPATYTCPPPAIVMGVRRHIVNPEVLGQWQFSIYFDMAKVADLDLAGVPVGPPVDAPPQLVVAEGTTEPLWLVDQGFRRAVAPGVRSAWRFDPASAAAMPADALAALPEGTPLAVRPVLVQGTGPAVYLLDARQCLADDSDPACVDPVEPTTGGETDPSGGETGTGATGESSSGAVGTSETGDAGSSAGTGAASTGPGMTDAGETGCGCRARPGAAGWLWLLVLGVRRRAARTRVGRELSRRRRGGSGAAA